MTSSKPRAAGFTKHKEITEDRCARPSEMVERVAAAIDPVTWQENYRADPAHYWELRRWVSLEKARAAIEAMKYVDGFDEADAIKIGTKYHLDAVSGIEIWDGVIDAALTPPSAGLPPKHKERG